MPGCVIQYRPKREHLRDAATKTDFRSWETAVTSETDSGRMRRHTGPIHIFIGLTCTESTPCCSLSAPNPATFSTKRWLPNTKPKNE
jgi:hypothetical protein